MATTLIKEKTVDQVGLQYDMTQLKLGANVFDGTEMLTAGTQTIAGAKTFSSDVILGTGTTLNLDSQTGSLTSNALTITKRAGQITTEALTTAAGASQAFVLTLTGVAATDLAFIQHAGGTNTREEMIYKAVCTTNTLTVTVTNAEETDAINGTLIFNYIIFKA